MNIADVIDIYVIDSLSGKTFTSEDKRFSVLISAIVFALSVFSKSLANSLIFRRDFNFFCFVFFTNSSVLVFLISLYLFSAFIICLLLRKKVSIEQLLCIILNCFSSYFLLLPTSLICYHLGWSMVYPMVEFAVSANIIFSILKRSKVYLGLNFVQLLFMIIVPILVLLLPILSIVGSLVISMYI